MGALIYRPEERVVGPNSVDLEWFADLARMARGAGIAMRWTMVLPTGTPRLIL